MIVAIGGMKLVSLCCTVFFFCFPHSERHCEVTEATTLEHKQNSGEERTLRDKKASGKLWPLIQEALCHGHKAHYRGLRAFVDGEEIFLDG